MSPQSNLQNMKQRFKDKFVSPWMVDDGADNMLWNKKAPTPNEILVFISQELQKAREERDEEIKEKQDFGLHLARLIWRLRDQITSQQVIAAKNLSKEKWSEYFEHHLGGYDSIGILMKAVKLWRPEIYSREGKSIKAHFEEVEEYLNSLSNKEK